LGLLHKDHEVKRNGKVPFEVMQECVYPFTAKESKDPDVILGSAFGEDVAVTRVGDDLLLSHVDPIVGAVNGIGWLAVHVACNDIAASGIKPRWIQLLSCFLTGGHKRP